MSFIDTQIEETCVTDASMDDLEKALKAYGYTVEKTKYQITAKHGGFFSTNAHLSTITIVDDGNLRTCKDVETAKGYLCSPERGLLAQIVKYAESSELVTGNQPVINPTSSKQSTILGLTIVLSIVVITILLSTMLVILNS